jgi:hypothetical protein
MRGYREVRLRVMLHRALSTLSIEFLRENETKIQNFFRWLSLAYEQLFGENDPVQETVTEAGFEPGTAALAVGLIYSCCVVKYEAYPRTHPHV